MTTAPQTEKPARFNRGGYPWALCPNCGEYHVWLYEWRTEEMAELCRMYGNPLGVNAQMTFAGMDAT